LITDGDLRQQKKKKQKKWGAEAPSRPHTSISRVRKRSRRRRKREAIQFSYSLDPSCRSRSNPEALSPRTPAQAQSGTTTYRFVGHATAQDAQRPAVRSDRGLGPALLCLPCCCPMASAPCCWSVAKSRAEGASADTFGFLAGKAARSTPNSTCSSRPRMGSRYFLADGSSTSTCAMPQHHGRTVLGAVWACRCQPRHPQPAYAPTTGTFNCSPRGAGLRSPRIESLSVAESAFSSKGRATRDRNGDRLGTQSAPACGGGALWLDGQVFASPTRLFWPSVIAPRDHFRH